MACVSHSATAVVPTVTSASKTKNVPVDSKDDANSSPAAAESIYTWVKPVPPPVVKAPLYHSIHAGDAELSHAHSTFVDAAVRKDTGVLGKQVKETVRPDAFLRRRTGVTAGTAGAASSIMSTQSEVKSSSRQNQATRKPPVPSRKVQFSASTSSGKNFVEENAIEVMVATPRPASNATQNWLRKPEYGTVPAYLQRVKEEVIASQTLRSSSSVQSVGPQTRELEADERKNLLDGLMRRREEVMSRYHLIDHKKTSSSTSTLGEIRIKERLEAQLTQLDADIAKLSVSGPILVLDGASSSTSPRSLSGNRVEPPPGAYD